MKHLLMILFISFYSGCSHTQSSGWKLVWSDEFNYSGLPSPDHWAFDTSGNSSGWGNNEAEWYTFKSSNNARVKDGVLKITAIKENISGKNYSSARLTTKNIREWKYGKIEARIKLPPGKGTWPAFWMLGKNIGSAGWPLCGEIDIMEHVGFMKDSIFGSLHSETYNHVKGTQKTKGVFIQNPYSEFHTYAVDWSTDKIDFILDGKIYYTVTNEHRTVKEWPFDQPFFIILNLAVGGNWGGARGIDDSAFPATMEVDYIRVYQKK
ncbi:MAG: glycoside hydrolase family 16 protein [Chitinophagaceae bacterium]|nr:glycoside hydrolase family 16 protein [Chitinophagaceae bacterium]